jgi:2-(1,2-epoxy-1,2-dihydrophenyl)acetyl-CoA isomerase
MPWWCAGSELGVSDDPAAALDQELVRTLDGGVLWLTINRADSSNAIPYYVRDGLIDAFRAAHADLAVRAVVLTAAGDRHFCTGSDLRIRPPTPPKPEGAPDMVVGSAVHMMRTGFQRLMESIQDCQKPVIVALNGTAAGAGSMFTLAADLVVAAEHARLIQVFVRRGLVPDAGVAYLLPRIVGMHKAKELIFFGDDLTAPEMERLGIANKVVPGDQLLAATKEWAERLAQGPTKAIGWSKKLLHDASELSRRDVLEEEAMLVEINTLTHDGMEGVNSFRERRATQFTGW